METRNNEAKEEAAEKESTSAEVCFKPPQEFKPPSEGGADGKEWDVVCSFKTRGDGTICMTKLGEVAMPYDKEDKSAEKKEETGATKENKPDYSELTGQIMTGLGTAG